MGHDGHAARNPLCSIFISHSSRDNAVALQLRERLKEHGYHSMFLDFHPEDGIPAGRNWERELYRNLKLCGAVIALCSRHSVASRWCFAELAKARALGKNIFPIQLDDTPVDALLLDHQVVKLHEGDAAYDRLWSGLRAAGLDPSDDFRWDPNRPPYPGLDVFQEQDAGVFFGRDDETREALDVLTQMRRNGTPRLALVLGSSGSGKSSLVRAGVLPRLRKDAHRWLVLPMLRPGSTPLDLLAQSLAAAAPDDSPFADWRTTRDKLFAQGDGDAQVLIGAAADLRVASEPGEMSVLVVIDPLEELLASVPSAQTSALLKLLRHALEAQGVPLFVLATLRSDFLDVFQNHAALGGLAFASMPVGPMPVGHFPQVIEGPAARAALELESGLVQQMVHDAETDDALPLLAFTLRELYERCKSSGRLTLEVYRADLGGLQGSVARVVEGIKKLMELTEPILRALRAAFVKLVEVGEDGRFVRRTASWDEMPAAAQPVLERFIAQRLLTRSIKDGKRTVEVVHESLFRVWPELAGWLAESREFLLWRQRLRSDVAEWQQSGEPAALLWPVGRLAEARRYLDERPGDLSNKEQTFLRASIAEREREAERRRRLIQTLWFAASAALALALIASAASGVAFVARQKAVDNERIAQQEKAVADAQKTEAQLSLAQNHYVQGLTLLESGQSGKAIARFAKTLRLAPDHAPAATALYLALVNRWHPFGDRAVKSLNDLRELAYSPDGARVVCRAPRTIYVWETGRLDQKPMTLDHDNDIASMSFSADGRRLLTTDTTYGGIDQEMASGTVRVWDLGSGICAHRRRIKGMLWGAVFGPREQRVLVSSAFGPVSLTPVLEPSEDVWPQQIDADEHRADNASTRIAFGERAERLVWTGGFVGDEVYVWDTRTWTLLGKRKAGAGVSQVAIVPDGKTALLAGPNVPLFGLGQERFGYAVALDLGSLKTSTWAIQHTDVIKALEIDPSGTLAVTGSLDRSASLWRIEDGERLRTLDHSAGVAAAAFSPDGRLLVTGTEQGAVRVWNGMTGTPLSEETWLEGGVRSLRFHPDGCEFLVATDSALYRFSAASTEAGQLVLETGNPRMRTARFASSKGRELLVRSDDRVEVWDALTGKQIREFLVGNKSATIGDVEQSRFLVVTVDAETAEVWNALTSQLLIPPVKHKSKIVHAEFGPDGDELLTVSDRAIRITSLRNTGALVREFNHGDAAVVVAHFANDDLVLSADEDTIRLWGIKDGLLKGERRHDEHSRVPLLETDKESGKLVTSQSYSRYQIIDLKPIDRSNRFVVVFGHHGANALQPEYGPDLVFEDAQIWSLDPLRARSPALGKDEDINNVFAIPGQKLVTTSNAGNARVWDCRSATALGSPIKHEFPIFWAVPSPGGNYIALFGRSTSVHLWDVESGERVGRVLEHAAPVRRVRFVSDSGLLCTWADDGAARLWDPLIGAQMGAAISVGRGFRDCDIGLGGDLLVTVNDPGVATIRRIGFPRAFADTDGAALELAEAIGGWHISKGGYENRKRTEIPFGHGATESAAGRGPSVLEQWLVDVPEERRVFPAAGARNVAQYRDALRFGPSAVSYLVLLHDPCNAEALMQLAETAGSSKDPTLRPIVRVWARRAVELSRRDPAMEQRRQIVEQKLSATEARPPM